MAGRDAVIEKVNAIAERVGASEGIEVVEIQLAGAGKGRLLRIFIDKPGGVTHTDCETVSQQVGTILDVEDVIPGGAYTLEVSSPGVERKLTKPADFDRFAGQKAKLVLSEPVDNQKHWVGKLLGTDGGVIRLEAGPGKTVLIPLAHVQRANLKFEW